MTTPIDSETITDNYHEAKAAGSLAELPEDLKPHTEQDFRSD